MAKERHLTISRALVSLAERGNDAIPKIRFSDLPRGFWPHLLERVREREISPADLMRLQEWVRSEPQAPEGDGHKDFGPFKLCGSGEYPRTVLTKRMAAFGQKIE